MDYISSHAMPSSQVSFEDFGRINSGANCGDDIVCLSEKGLGVVQPVALKSVATSMSMFSFIHRASVVCIIVEYYYCLYSGSHRSFSLRGRSNKDLV